MARCEQAFAADQGTGLPAQRTMYGRDEAAFAGVREAGSRVGAGDAAATRDRHLRPARPLGRRLPLLGPVTANGDDTNILCEINASSVIPSPPEAPTELARGTLIGVTARAHGQ